MQPTVQLGEYDARGDFLAVQKTFGVRLPSIPRVSLLKTTMSSSDQLNNLFIYIEYIIDTDRQS